jgi:hypothetical protein
LPGDGPSCFIGLPNKFAGFPSAPGFFSSLAGLAPNVKAGALPSEGFDCPKTELVGAVVVVVPKRLVLGLGASACAVAGAETKTLGVVALVEAVVEPKRLLVGAAVALGVAAAAVAADPKGALLGSDGAVVPKMLDLGAAVDGANALVALELVVPKRIAAGSGGFWPKSDGAASAGLLPKMPDG